MRIPAPSNGEQRSAVRVLQLSDFHLSPVVSLEFIAEAIARGLVERPDLIAVTGDFFTTRCDEPDRYAEVLARLSTAAPTFACLGNHDGGFWSRRKGGYATIEPALELLRAARIDCLENDARELTIRGRTVQVIGVGDYWSARCNPHAAFRRTPSRGDAVRILLSHNPDSKRGLRSFDWDVLLCGHTHGGQLRLPWVGTPYAPVEDHRYVEGLHRWEERWLHVTRGVGNLHGVRFNCRPEVSVLEIA